MPKTPPKPSDISRQRRIGITLMIVLMVIGATGTFGGVFLKDPLRKLLGMPPKHGMTALHEAAARNDLARVRALVSGGAAVNVADRRGTTPLHMAAAATQDSGPAVVTYLLEQGAAVDARDAEGLTPLFLANTSGAAEALLARGANVHATSNTGLTALHTAAARGKTGVERLLLARGVSVDSRDDAGRTPLHHAAERGTGTAATVLLDAGADINAVDNSGNTPLKLTVRNLVTADVLRARGAKE